MFLTEKELVETLKFNYTDICKWNIDDSKISILSEVNLGFGIADLVISKIAKAPIKNDPLSFLDISIYKIIENSSGISFKEIKKYTGNNSILIKQSLEKLIQENYIKETDTLFKICKSYKTFIEETIAIEAKLKNWKRALNQAYRYKWFASKAFVVLDSKHTKAAISNIDEFKKHNVGLASISPDGTVKIFNNPKKQKPLNSKMTMQLGELFIRGYLDNKNDFQMAR